MRCLVSMDEIAKYFNVSKVTVSKALNDKEGVSEELRKEIKQKAEELGYRINQAARSLKTNKNYNIGVIIPSRFIGFDTSYYFGVYTKIVKKFTDLGYSVILEILSSEFEKKLQYPEMYINNKVDGIIVMGQLSEDYLKLFSSFDIQVVFFDFYSDHSNVDSIVIDNFYGGYQATELLIEKGHREIGFVGNLYSTTSIQDRFLGYYRSLLCNKIKINEDYCISDRDENGELIILELPKKMPTAFVCNNDQVAYELIKKLNENGYKVPDDCSIVAFDNTIYSTISDPQITTIDTNAEEMVNVVCKVILKKITKPEKKYSRILVKPTIVIRDTVKERK